MNGKLRLKDGRVVDIATVIFVAAEHELDPLDVLQYYGLDANVDLYIRCPHDRYVLVDVAGVPYVVDSRFYHNMMRTGYGTL
jgi:hypothetical protein